MNNRLVDINLQETGESENSLLKFNVFRGAEKSRENVSIETLEFDHCRCQSKVSTAGQG